MSDGCLELPEEAYVVLEVQPEVFHLPFQHGYAFNSHAKRETGVFLRVYAAGFQDIGVYHAGTHNLQPAGTLADVAALAAADIAADVHLCAGLGEGEVRGAHAYLGVRTEHLAHEYQDGLLEVGEGYIFVHIQPFYLMEYAVGAG